MLTLFLIVTQIILAFFIASTLYLVAAYYLRMASGPKHDPPQAISFRNHHLAIVFNQYIPEEQLLEQLHYLQNQSYQNYSAYFFIDEPYVTINNLKHIHVIRPTHKKPGKFGLLHLVKGYIIDSPDAIVVVDPFAAPQPDFLSEMNRQLCMGYRVVQSKVSIAGQQANKRDFYHFIDREAHQASGISPALWKHGFLIHTNLYRKLNFSTYIHSDKQLQAELITRSERIAYAPAATVLERAPEEGGHTTPAQSRFTEYLFNYHLGFNLLLEGLRNPGYEKIIFAINFMRPPLVATLLASLTLLAITLAWMPQVTAFLWLSAPGILCSIVLLLKPVHPLRFIQSLKQMRVRAITDPT